ncbi:DUF943 family protein [Lelliottia sp. V106_10]|uniref:DUF943 family protein n=1 Tax=Lelliottia TaxID=1330545 RepID=UPI002549D1AA|nr:MULTISPECIES: DUF943 family protein [unclassified Lelliottia]MDK9356338.1 DUF943 family protein [Lelliottia sp. V106_16]MDK9374275.1 DUF943 family protein [Lelliottia sp. V106_10]MDK9601545.1 DUF943 family protein [Lelliottia sp. V106_5]
MRAIFFLKKPLALVFLMLAFYNACTLQKVNVLFSENIWSGDYVIAVDHLPLTDLDKINWFYDNKEILRNRYHISVEHFESIVIMEAVGGIKNSHSRWIDDYYCFRDIDSDNRCVDKSMQMRIDRDQDGTVTFYIYGLGGIYVQGTDGSLQKSNYERYFEDLDKRLGNSLDRWLFR